MIVHKARITSKKAIIISLSLVAAVILALSGIAHIKSLQKRSQAPSDNEPDPILPPLAFVALIRSDTYQIAAQNEDLTLYIRPDTGAIMVVDDRNGSTWKSIADETVYDPQQVNDFHCKQMNSLFSVQYMSREAVESSVNSSAKTAYAFSSDEKNEISYYALDNGLGMLFHINEANMDIAIEFRLENNQLVVNVPIGRIKEYDGARLIKLDLMPYFGAASASVEGYMTIPDGCGSLVYHQNIGKRDKGISGGVWSLYGPEKVTALITQEEVATLPVFGIKNGIGAMLAAATIGAEDNSISVMPGGYIMDLDRAYFTFRYRYSYEYSLSNITVYGVNSNQQLSTYNYTEDIINTDRTVRFFFLSGDEANYSGMANAYREHLITNGLLNQVIDANESIPLGVELFMGTSEESMLKERFVSMTTFSEAEQICKQLLSMSASNLEVTIKGWTKGGYGEFPVVWPPENKIGGKSGLAAFADYTRTAGITTYLRQDFYHANADNHYFSTRRDTVQQGSGVPITDGMGNFLINTAAAIESATSFLADTRKFCNEQDNQFGVAYDAIGSIIFHDFTRSGIATRTDIIQAWTSLIKIDDSRPIAIEGGNLYSLTYADRLYEIAEETNKYWCSDQEIPLYQMVVHGSIPYSSISGNLSNNFAIQKLKWVEYGSMPFFELTNEKAVKLMETASNDLFASYYLDWIDIAADVYTEFNTRIASVWSQPIIKHEIISDYLRRIEYGNGTVIYINYSDTVAQLDGYELPAMDYIVVEKE